MEKLHQPTIEELYEEYKNSGLTRPDFCKTKGISYDLFRYNITKMNKANSKTLSSTNGMKGFTEIQNPFSNRKEESSDSKKWFSLVIELGVIKFQIQLEGLV